MTLEPSMTLKRHTPVFYPESDGKPMAETDVHRKEATAFIDALEEHFRDDGQVYVAGNNFFYYREGHPHTSCSPDVYVVHGVEKKHRRSYKLWEEGHVPSFIMELSSRSTYKADKGSKMVQYARLGVKEYFLYDPEADVLYPPLRGYRLASRAGEYRRMMANADGGFNSKVLGLTLWTDEAHRLHYADAATGEELLRYSEAVAQRQHAERRCREQALRARYGRA